VIGGWKGWKDDLFASAIRANATSTLGEKAGYQNDATRMDPRTWLKPGATQRKRSANVSARPGGALPTTDY
jgi:hypothetical protein